MAFPVLVITGPVGSGKTSVLSELAYLLGERGVPHAAVELDALSEYFPRPESDPYGTTLGLRNLADMWRNFRAAGAERLVLGYHVESQEELTPLYDALPDAEITIVRLRARVAVLQERLRRRELGAGQAWHVARAAEVAPLFDRLDVSHIVIDTADRHVRAIAEEILTLTGWSDRQSRARRDMR